MIRNSGGTRWMRPGGAVPQVATAATSEVGEIGGAEAASFDAQADVPADALVGSAPTPVTQTPVGEVKGVGPIREQRLMQAGILTAEALAATTPEELLRVETWLPRSTAAGRIDQAAGLVGAPTGEEIA